MAAESQITLLGNLTKDPKLEYTAGGTAILKMSVACNRRYKKGDEWQDETSFFFVVCWTELAENVAASAQKGDRVVVSGRLQQRSWTTESDEKRSVVEVVADDVALSMRYATCAATRITRSQGQKREAKTEAAEADFFNNDEPF